MHDTIGFCCIEIFLGEVKGDSIINIRSLGSTNDNYINPLNEHGFFSIKVDISRNDRLFFSINWILFDEQFKFVAGNFSRVGNNSEVKNHYGDAQLQNIQVARNGYLYVYVSNESPVNVFFDNLQVVHTRGALLEETHYYPFGLTMAGISSKALISSPENKYKFNGAELNKDFDLNQYEFFYRNYDPQIGRWHSIDTKPNELFSPYAAMSNNPVLLADPLGDTTYRFNMDGIYLGMVDLDVAGIRGVAGNVTQVKDAEGNLIDQFNPERNFAFNDGDLDREQLGALNVGDKGITFLNDENLNALMSDAGVQGESNLFKRWGKALENSPTGKLWDFSSSYLMPASGLNPENKVPEGDNKGGFFIIGSSSTVAYNINDAGNFLWGQTMSRIGIDLGNAKIAANINSKATGNGWDSAADQRAIGQGYTYKVQTASQITHRIFLAPSVRKNANHSKQRGL